MIRAVRHAARANFKMDQNCRKSILSKHNLIRECPSMRLYEELKKDFSSGHLLSILQLLREYSLLEHFLPFLCSKSYLHLWEHNSFFFESIASVDALVRLKSSDSITATLALFVLFYINPSLDAESLNKIELKVEYLSQQTRNAFESFAVPKKEKERIVIVIREALRSGVERTQGKRKRGRPSALSADAACLLHFLGLKEFAEDKYSQKDFQTRNPRPYKRKAGQIGIKRRIR